MADVWLGLCAQDAQEGLRRALLTIDCRARIAFASSAQDLRMRVSDATESVGALVGPLEDGVSSVNLAAALVRDGMACDVVLVAPEVSRGLRERASKAGISRVVDLSQLAAVPIDDLDEPFEDYGDMPTMVIDVPMTFSATPVPAPRPPAREGGAGTRRLLSLPLVEGPAHMARDLPEPDAMCLDEPASPAGQPMHATQPTQRGRDAELPVLVEPGQPVEPVAEKAAPLEGHSAASGEGRVPQTVAEAPAPGEGSPVIVLVSGRGGVGKTSVVAAMALAAESWGMRVAALDLDLACGNLYSCFGMGSIADLASLPEDADALSHDLAELGRAASQDVTLWGPCELPEMSESVAPHAGRILRALQDSSDLVLVDTSSTFTDAVAQAAQACDRLVIVVDNRPGSMVAQARLASLAVRLGVARTRIVRLANRCGPHGRGEPAINRAEVGLEACRTLRVADGGAEVTDSLAEGRVQDLRDLGSRFYTSAASALATMLSELGCLPATAEARKALEGGTEKPRWGFGLRREVG